MSLSLRDLYEQSKNEDISSFSGDNWEPVEGETYTVSASLVRASTTRTGLPRWGVMFTVAEGDDQGKKFWDNWNLTQQYPKIDARTFHYLELIGLTIDVLDQELSDEQLSEIAKNSGNVVKVKAKYKQDKNDSAKLWADHTYESAGSSDTVVVTEETTEEDDFDF